MQVVETAEFARAAAAAQIPPGSMLGVRVGDTDVLIVNVEGSFHAIKNICTHKQGILSNGKLDGKIVTCPRHGSMFDVTTGKSIAGPKILGVRGKTDDEPSYEVKLDGPDIFVKIP